METTIAKKTNLLPQQVSLIGLIQSRCSELNQLISDIKSRSPKLSSQRLPIHMRRRAASHNINRLPSETRKLVLSKGQGATEAKKKRGKKHGKCKKAIVLSQLKRSDKRDRTLLHLWFVKRFKMMKVFDLILPSHNSTKNQRKIHKHSKEDCVHFYLPQLRSIIIEIGDLDCLSQKLVEVLNKDLQQFFEDGIKAVSTTVHFYENKGENSEIIGPGNLIYIKTVNLLFIRVHILIYDKILESLTKTFNDTSNTVLDGGKTYQNFCLFGSKSLNHVKKVLGKCGDFLPSIFEEGIVHNLNWRFATDWNNSIRSDGDYTLDYIFLAEMRMFKNREVLILTLPFGESKKFWYELVRNRSHLVGGLRDLETLLCETSHLNFPSTGYPDLSVESNADRELWSQIMMINCKSSDYFLLRDSSIISSLRNTADIVIIENLIKSVPRLIQSFIYVEIDSLNRGVPSKGDIICLPTETDVKKYIGHTRIDIKLSEIGYGPEESIKLSKFSKLEQSCRKVIGLVEYGHFSLDDGAGKGFAAIALSSLPDLMRLNQSELLALTRSNKSPTFRFVKIIITNLTDFN